ncbi:hypothetical protein EV379_0507 [Microterricola gilva]|uniref:Uncharacterized protein n=1 Tax=Microterricola gilva TaxID=393267 RepID=A0A4Q8AJY6_9MICO|nr:hypothetical protein [Microterricola gilva]RZU64213.1 hypothetical protein EV379_0507 [Microterricola gilva]
MGNRTTHTWRTPGGAVALSLLLAVMLSGCSAPTQPEAAGADSSPSSRPLPSSSIAASPVPIPTAEQQLERVAGLVARPDALELRDSDGAVVATLGYMSSPAEAIDVLSTVLGSQPASEEYSGNMHNPPGIYHSWGDFVLDERLYDEQMRIDKQLDYLVWPRFAVYFDASASNEMPLSSVQGIQAGDSWAFASEQPGFDSELFTCIGTPVEVLDITAPDGTPAQATVIVVESDEGTVRWVGAPEMVADGCA